MKKIILSLLFVIMLQPIAWAAKPSVSISGMINDVSVYQEVVGVESRDISDYEVSIDGKLNPHQNPLVWTRCYFDGDWVFQSLNSPEADVLLPIQRDTCTADLLIRESRPNRNITDVYLHQVTF